MNSTVENDFFALYEVMRPEYTGEVDKLRFLCTKNHKYRMVFHVTETTQQTVTLIKYRCLFNCKIRSSSFRHFSVRRANIARNNRLMDSYMVKSAKIFTHFWEIAVFMFGRFILTHPLIWFLRMLPRYRYWRPFILSTSVVVRAPAALNSRRSNVIISFRAHACWHFDSR